MKSIGNKINQESAIVALLPFKLNEDEPRHHNFHLALSTVDQTIHFVTLKDEDDIVTNQIKLFSKWVLLPIPILGLPTLLKFRSLWPKVGGLKTLYLYEGSMPWAINLLLLNLVSGIRFRIVVNLFTSNNKFKAIIDSERRFIRRKLLFLVIQTLRKNGVILTIDESLNIKDDSLSKILHEFPLFSALPANTNTKEVLTNEHREVAIFKRNITDEKMVGLLNVRCLDCKFWIPDYLMSLIGNTVNLYSIPWAISRDNYSNFLERFDYVVLFYQTQGFTSGKVLDLFQLRIPVCIPNNQTFLLRIASKFSFYKFDIESPEELFVAVNHPVFEYRHSVEDFGPDSFIPRLREIVDSVKITPRNLILTFFPVTLLLAFEAGLIGYGVLIQFRAKLAKCID